MEKVTPQIRKKGLDFIRRRTRACPGTGKGEGLVRSIAWDFGNMFSHKGTVDFILENYAFIYVCIHLYI